MRTVAIIQARMGSTRLPGKVLRDLGGAPMLARVIERTRRAKLVDEVVVATTTDAGDDAIAAFCGEFGCPSFRGDEQDVLDRYCRASLVHHAEAVVRITSDCPLIDPGVLDLLVAEFQSHQPETDYACNLLPQRTFPRGLDAEIMRADVLERCWREATEPANREHVTSFIYQHPEQFRLRGIESGGDWSHLRWTVDTPEDLELARAIYVFFGHDRFDWREALAACAQHPEWSDLNRHIVQKAH